MVIDNRTLDSKGCELVQNGVLLHLALLLVMYYREVE